MINLFWPACFRWTEQLPYPRLNTSLCTRTGKSGSDTVSPPGPYSVSMIGSPGPERIGARLDRPAPMVPR